jgi:AcrR family transcriptional regulator
MTPREQLIARATPIFAAKGFAAASTREICQAAGVNAAAIHYHFGDKEGLYREVLLRPLAEPIDPSALTFDEAVRRLRALDTRMMKLHLREMLEPSAAFRKIREKAIVPVHAALAGVIARECGLKKPDARVERLALAMAAMFSVLAQPLGYCRALLEHEIARRKKRHGSRN